MRSMFLISGREMLILVGIVTLLVILAIPGFRDPIVSDTIIYALSGESFWTTGAYSYFGVPVAKHLPFHAVFSYLFVGPLGYQLGMKISSLVGGVFAVLATFWFVRETFTERIALIAALFFAIHHGFLYMVMAGSSDPLFTALFLATLASYAAASRSQRWYVLMGVFLGLACLTRYNGAPLFVLIPLFTFWKRKKDLFSPLFISGVVIGAGLFSLWFIRNYFTFGNPFFTEYASEFSKESPNIAVQIVRNLLFYLNPLHNILILFPFAVYGVFSEGKRKSLALLGMLSAWVFTSFWWVEGMRFALPGYPILLAFGAWGVFEFMKWIKIPTHTAHKIIFSVFFVLHFAAMLPYAYGSVNAWFDRTVGILPPDLGLSSEGSYTLTLAIDYINENAERRASVLLDRDRARAWNHGIFRNDLQLAPSMGEASCPLYEITSHPAENSETVFETDAHPVRFVTLQRCP